MRIAKGWLLLTLTDIVRSPFKGSGLSKMIDSAIASLWLICVSVVGCFEMMLQYLGLTEYRVWLTFFSSNKWSFMQSHAHVYQHIIESLRSTTRQKRQRHKFCIFNEQKQKLCTPFTCLFHFCTFLSSSRQICDVKWPFLKFYREHEHSGANLNIIL